MTAFPYMNLAILLFQPAFRLLCGAKFFTIPHLSLHFNHFLFAFGFLETSNLRCHTYLLCPSSQKVLSVPFMPCRWPPTRWRGRVSIPWHSEVCIQRGFSISRPCSQCRRIRSATPGQKGGNAASAGPSGRRTAYGTDTRTPFDFFSASGTSRNSSSAAAGKRLETSVQSALSDSITAYSADRVSYSGVLTASAFKIIRPVR